MQCQNLYSQSHVFSKKKKKKKKKKKIGKEILQNLFASFVFKAEMVEILLQKIVILN